MDAQVINQKIVDQGSKVRQLKGEKVAKVGTFLLYNILIIKGEKVSRVDTFKQVKNYIVRSYRDVIEVTNSVTRRTSKA